jgi:phosphoribosylformylglycinamidine synthase
VERFDSTIGAGSVLMPFGGSALMSPAEVSVCKIPVPGETNTATILAHGYDPVIAKWSPFHGAVFAIVEALAKITAAGGDYTRTRLSLQEYFEKLTTPEKWGKALSGLLGAYFAQIKTGVPAIGGKDSMSGTFGDGSSGKDLNVPPVVAAFGLCVADARDIISPEFKREGSTALLLPLPRDGAEIPDFDYMKTLYTTLHRLIAQKRIISARSVGSGGLCAAVSKLCFGNMIGFRFAREMDYTALFSRQYGAVIVEVDLNENYPEVSAPEEMFKGLKFQLLGHTTGSSGGNPCISVNGAEIPLEQCVSAWEAPLGRVFPIRPEPAAAERAVREKSNGKEPGDQANGDLPLGREALFLPRSNGQITLRRRFQSVKIARPRVFIPVFPGTNCETDTARAFKKAGALVEEFVFKNLSRGDIDESIEQMARQIRACQILALPGGFSAGDEPDGSAKFIAAVFRNPAIADAVTELLKRRDGLVLGICNGFQALIKLGLLTPGIPAPGPTLTYNSIGRHVSKIARTKIVSVNSPWLYGVKPGDIHTVPVSHGEGRFAASPECLARLYEAGQVAAVYYGENPNGSAGGVEALISPCGGVLGKMGHSERAGENLYKNVPGVYEQKIFESGTAYFM